MNQKNIEFFVVFFGSLAMWSGMFAAMDKSLGFVIVGLISSFICICFALKLEDRER